MPVSSETKTVKEEGQDKEALVVSFTNGARAQLEQLQEFIGTEDPLDVVKLGISYIQRMKEIEDRKKQRKEHAEISV